MRIAQERTPAGCLWALAAGWLVISLVMQKDLMLDYVVVGLMVAGAIFMMIYRKVYPDSTLITDALPQPGETFRGKIETPLKNEPGECKVQLALTRRRGRNSRAIWQSDDVAHPVHGERGIVFPVQFSIPAEVQKEIDAYCTWRLSARAKVMPLTYRATFAVEDSARSRAASA